jgi:hypothetical protein
MWDRKGKRIVPRRATFRCEHVNCGRCPKKHGPYWYAYWRDQGQLRKRYIGRQLGRPITRMLARRSAPTRHVRTMIWRTEKAPPFRFRAASRSPSGIRDG